MKLVLTAEMPAELASRITIGRVVPGTRNPTKAWIRDLVTAGASVGQQLEVRDVESMASSRDWPVFAASVDVIGAGGAVTESRLVAVYMLLQFAAPVTLRCGNAQELAQLRATALPILLSGRPDSTDDLVCVQDLFQ